MGVSASLIWRLMPCIHIICKPKREWDMWRIVENSRVGSYDELDDRFAAFRDSRGFLVHVHVGMYVIQYTFTPNTSVLEQTNIRTPNYGVREQERARGRGEGSMDSIGFNRKARVGLSINLESTSESRVENRVACCLWHELWLGLAHDRELSTSPQTLLHLSLFSSNSLTPLSILSSLSLSLSPLSFYWISLNASVYYKRVLSSYDWQRLNHHQVWEFNEISSANCLLLNSPLSML